MLQFSQWKRRCCCRVKVGWFVAVLQICQPVLLLCNRGPGQWAHHSGDHPQIRRAAGQILWQCTFSARSFTCCVSMTWHDHLLNIQLRYYSFLISVSFNLWTPGLWAGHYFQLWEGLLHSGWIPAGWGSSGDVQKERIEGHWAGWLTAGGKAPNENNEHLCFNRSKSGEIEWISIFLHQYCHYSKYRFQI